MKKLLLGSLICASALFAQDYKYEITPMIGGAYTEGNMDMERNYANVGLSFGINLEDYVFDQVELGILSSIEDVDYDGNNGDTNVTRIFSNLVKDYKLSEKSSLYALIGVGYEIFDKEAFENEDSMFGNYGFGYKYKLDNDISVKFDLRHLIETDHGDNNLLYTVGLSIPFGPKGQPAAPMMDKDSDNDGVMDSKDKCPNSPAGAKVDADGCAVMVDLSINFDTDSAVVKPQYDGKVKAFADFMHDNKNVNATIEAHTDSVGSEAYNQKLSERRAASTVKALEAKNVEATRLKSEGFGETKPVASNATAEGRAQNRRVQAVIERVNNDMMKNAPATNRTTPPALEDKNIMAK